MKGDELKLPDFLDIVQEVTADRSYSMYNLSRKSQEQLRKEEATESAPKKVIAPTEQPENSQTGIVANGTHS